MNPSRALPTRDQIDRAAAIVYRHMRPTPQYAWPLLADALGAQVWLKHENHTPIGAFKVRGGVVYFERLAQREPACRGVVGATKGNHGQSIGFAARRTGIAATVVVPLDNSREKNAAMRAQGVRLIEHGHDFQAAADHAQHLAQREGLHLVPAFDADLVAGVATYWSELFDAVPDLDRVYVPIGLGSGINAAIAVREARGLRTRIIGVVSAQAPSYARSFAARRAVEAATNTRIADGLACRVPHPDALPAIWSHVDEVIEVGDDEVESAMRLLFRATHNTAEGAGAAALAGAIQQRSRIAGRKLGLVLSGGNIDSDAFARVLAAGNEGTTRQGTRE